MMTLAQELAEALFAQLGEQPLSDWLLDRRDAGESWYVIADRFRDLTGVRVSHVTLQTWSTSTQDAA